MLSTPWLAATESQIVAMLNEGQAGVKVEDICRQYGIAKSSYYKLRSKYQGMGVSDLQRLKELEDENRRLKQMYADISLEHNEMTPSLPTKTNLN
ncbi:transposase [Piscirickettsia salmonis]|uniref:Transposase n=1 Tax=Piscirickettsia salmonis TaxID=1238 RepID=A0A9Q6LSX3_PISSA|nr:transposase [Piscirickettsia salmonis]WGZ70875.1 transposase [Piscirickettsia salmonis EM-90]ALA25024.1 transposase [Piscirickettsia salmonis]QGN77312.1 Transposase [Piscirickettsia salmonis]QGN80897.1 Transposase [Piscirickettsia salmonis]QGN84827.1 Transposase [Piscirickettsia salmonis]